MNRPASLVVPSAFRVHSSITSVAPCSRFLSELPRRVNRIGIFIVCAGRGRGKRRENESLVNQIEWKINQLKMCRLQQCRCVPMSPPVNSARLRRLRLARLGARPIVRPRRMHRRHRRHANETRAQPKRIKHSTIATTKDVFAFIVSL